MRFLWCYFTLIWRDVKWCDVRRRDVLECNVMRFQWCHELSVMQRDDIWSKESHYFSQANNFPFSSSTTYQSVRQGKQIDTGNSTALTSPFGSNDVRQHLLSIYCNLRWQPLWLRWRPRLLAVRAPDSWNLSIFFPCDEQTKNPMLMAWTIHLFSNRSYVKINQNTRIICLVNIYNHSRDVSFIWNFSFRISCRMETEETLLLT